MQLAYAILADNAQVMPDGKFTIFSGGIEVLTAPSLPALTPSLAIVIRLVLEPGEIDIQHHFHVELLNPDGENLLSSDSGKQFTPNKNTPVIPDLPLSYMFVLNFPGLIFLAAGKHMFRLFVDGTLIGEIPMFIVESSKSKPIANDEEV